MEKACQAIAQLRIGKTLSYCTLYISAEHKNSQLVNTKNLGLY